MRIDRYTRWTEVFPVQDTTAETNAKELYAGWISHFDGTRNRCY